jgi:single-strand DNA-binding protein
MTDLITVTGVVGSDPRHTVTNQGLAITSFRLASTRRYFDRAKGSWEDGETNWFTVATFRNLAVNAARSLRKGERVVVRGRLRLRAWDTGEKSGLAVEIEADAVGHDLTWGTADWRKAGPSRSADALAPAESGEPGAGSGWPMAGEAPASSSYGGFAADTTDDDLSEGSETQYDDGSAADADEPVPTELDETAEQAAVLAG